MTDKTFEKKELEKKLEERDKWVSDMLHFTKKPYDKGLITKLSAEHSPKGDPQYFHNLCRKSSEDTHGKYSDDMKNLLDSLLSEGLKESDAEARNYSSQNLKSILEITDPNYLVIDALRIFDKELKSRNPKEELERYYQKIAKRSKILMKTFYTLSARDPNFTTAYLSLERQDEMQDFAAEMTSDKDKAVSYIGKNHKKISPIYPLASAYRAVGKTPKDFDLAAALGEEQKAED